MNFLRKKFDASPEFARAAPYIGFVMVTFLQGALGPAAPYWVYLLKTIGGAWIIWEMRPFVEEMRWRVSWEAVVVGVAVCAMWIGLDGHYPRLAEPKAGWNPGAQFGQNSAAAWWVIAVRIVGDSMVVTP